MFTGKHATGRHGRGGALRLCFAQALCRSNGPAAGLRQGLATGIRLGLESRLEPGLGPGLKPGACFNGAKAAVVAIRCGTGAMSRSCSGCARTPLGSEPESSSLAVAEHRRFTAAGTCTLPPESVSWPAPTPVGGKSRICSCARFTPLLVTAAVAAAGATAVPVVVARDGRCWRWRCTAPEPAGSPRLN